MKKMILLFFSAFILFADNIKELEIQCNHGDLKACFEAANYYSSKNHQNAKKSIKLFTYACNKGYAEACSVLGFIYYSDFFGYNKNNSKKAVELLKKGCNEKSAYGCWYLAESYYKGKGVKKNKTLACRFWKKTKDLNDSYWSYFAKEVYNKKCIYEKIIEETNKILSNKCLNKKNANACDAIASMYLNGKDGFEQNYKKAFKYFKMACDLGSVEGCNNLGYMYGTGKGGVVNKNENIAIKYYERACKKNFKPACRNLGVIYYQKAQRFSKKGNTLYTLINLRKSCIDYNLPQACYWAGIIAYNWDKKYGGYDKKLLKEYFEKGCKLGDKRACDFLNNHPNL